MEPSTLSEDPFVDPAVPVEIDDGLSHDILNAGRNARLTLGSESLIVLDEGFDDGGPSCCGLVHPNAKNTRTILYYNILWATLTKVDLAIRYAKPLGKRDVSVATLRYALDLSSTTFKAKAELWVTRLLDRAYTNSKKQKRIKVLINPFGGAGKAPKWYPTYIEPVFAAANCELDVQRTTYQRHAEDIAGELDLDAFDVIACCSGDGVPHEAFNGLAKRVNGGEALRKIAVVQLPCGSGNAMSWNLNGTGSCSMAALAIVKGIRMPLDLVSVTQGEKRTLSFLSQAIGVVAESDLGTNNIRWMGSARFTFGFLVRVLGKTVYPCDIAVKTDIEDKIGVKAHYRNILSSASKITKPPAQDESQTLPPLKYGTVSSPLPPDWTLIPYPNMGNFYAGNMPIVTADTPLFPAALPSDGLLDLVTTDGDISRVSSIALILAVEKGTFFDIPNVRIRKVSAFRVVPKFGKWASERGGEQGKGADGGFIAVDGEQMPFEPFQVEVHKGLGTVLSKSGYKYEASGPSGWEISGERDETAHSS